MSELMDYNPMAVSLAGAAIVIETLSALVDKGLLTNVDAKNILERVRADFADRASVMVAGEALRFIDDKILPRFR